MWLGSNVKDCWTDVLFVGHVVGVGVSMGPGRVNDWHLLPGVPGGLPGVVGLFRMGIRLSEHFNSAPLVASWFPIMLILCLVAVILLAGSHLC